MIISLSGTETTALPKGKLEHLQKIAKNQERMIIPSREEGNDICRNTTNQWLCSEIVMKSIENSNNSTGVQSPLGCE